MVWVVIAIVIAGLSLLILTIKRRKNRDQLEHSITPEELHTLLATGQTVPLFDVRQPLDLLAHLEIIPTAQRIAPDLLIANPSLIPKDKEVIVYCTCPGEKTSREILRRALAMGYSRVKFLCGGLAAWKANGYPVEPYREVFQLRDAMAQHTR